MDGNQRCTPGQLSVAKELINTFSLECGNRDNRIVIRLVNSQETYEPYISLYSVQCTCFKVNMKVVEKLVAFLAELWAQADPDGNPGENAYHTTL